ncbi:hypothetical protein B296_00019746 [Ensete ventricosum]|uniref:Uncharacterized protein n=1 Tax=Ensete ventricosum TaxID=4639 RepID=A0A427A7C1_ENSVE|nr:hypothetical protein B296_00019746 [Ensete ventricosum]
MGSRDRDTSPASHYCYAGPQEQDVSTIGPRGTLVRNCRSRPRDIELSFEDKAEESGSVRTLARGVAKSRFLGVTSYFTGTVPGWELDHHVIRGLVPLLRRPSHGSGHLQVALLLYLEKNLCSRHVVGE